MVTRCLAALVVAAPWTAIGLGLVALLARPLPLLPRIAWSYLAGLTAWSAALFALSHWASLPLDAAHLRPALLLAAAAGVAIAAATSVRRRRQARATGGTTDEQRTPTTPWRRSRARWYVAAPVLLGVLLGIGVAAAALIDPIADWDGRITWGAHARYMLAAASADAPVLRDARWAVAHPRYPPLLPLAQLTALVLDGDERVVKLLYAAFWPLLLLLSWDGVRRLVRAPGEEGAVAPGAHTLAIAGVVAVFVMSVPFLTFFPDGGATGAYSDLPLACLVGGAALLLLDDGEPVRAGLLAGLLLGGVALAKNEGALLAPAVLLGGAVALGVRRLQGGGARDALRRAAGRLALALLPWLAAVALLASWRAAIPNRLDEDYAQLATLARLRDGLPRLGEILALVARQALVPRLWLLTWPLLAAGLAAGLVARRWREPWFAGLLALVAAALPGYLLAYLVTSWPVAELVPVTAGRFLLQLVLPLLLLAAPALAPLVPPPRR